MILKDLSLDKDSDAVYEIVEDDQELQGVLGVFEQLLEDVELTL